MPVEMQTDAPATEPSSPVAMCKVDPHTVTLLMNRVGQSTEVAYRCRLGCNILGTRIAQSI